MVERPARFIRHIDPNFYIEDKETLSSLHSADEMFSLLSSISSGTCGMSKAIGKPGDDILQNIEDVSLFS